ncbi:MAG: hypothetical protein KCHDKBKB_02099 [Elusimicrobia bacterium]|nr:hypothetical protein [Elusimicrobiota bacterium]
MNPLNLPKINDGLLHKPLRNIDEIVDFLLVAFKNNWVDKESVRLQKRGTHVDHPFRILPLNSPSSKFPPKPGPRT